MKRFISFNLSVVLILIILTPVNPAMAAKPLPLIESGNSYPSGPHYNLNIHGNTTTISSAILSPYRVRQACNDTDTAEPLFRYYTQCLNSDPLALGLIVGSAVPKSGPFTRQTGTISLLKARHLAMLLFAG